MSVLLLIMNFKGNIKVEHDNLPRHALLSSVGSVPLINTRWHCCSLKLPLPELTPPDHEVSWYYH